MRAGPSGGPADQSQREVIGGRACRGPSQVMKKVDVEVLVYNCPDLVGAAYEDGERKLIQIHAPSARIGLRGLISLGHEMVHVITPLKGRWVRRCRAVPPLGMRVRYWFDEILCYLLAPVGVAAFAVLLAVGKAEYKIFCLDR